MRNVIVTFLLFSLTCCASDPQQDTKGNATPPEKEYQNPVDRKTYTAPDGWKTYKPETLRQAPAVEKVSLANIRLLTSETEIEARVIGRDSEAKAGEMSRFIKEAERLAKETFSDSQTPFQVMVQFACTPSGHSVKLARQGDVSQETLQKYYTALTAIKPLPVKTGDVSFQFEVSVKP